MASSVLIAGHSHIAALGVPLVQDNCEIQALVHDNFPVFGLTGGWPREDSDYWQQLVARATGRIIAIFWRGNQHFQHFLIAPADAFDFMLDDEPDLPVESSCHIVPEAAVSEFMRCDMEELDALIVAIHAAGGIVALCGTPPPKADELFVRQKIMREGYFQETAAELGVDLENVNLSSPLLLYKLWAVMQNALRDIADRHGAQFVAVPRRAQTEAGFLHPQCYADDATHANALYGRWMLDEMRSCLSRHLGAGIET